MATALSPLCDFLAGSFKETFESGTFSLPISYEIASVGLIWLLSHYFQMLSTIYLYSYNTTSLYLYGMIGLYPYVIKCSQ